VYNNPYAESAESSLLGADPMQLVVALYEGAMDRVRDARHYLASGDVMARGRAITKAAEIITELVQSLDKEKGGELATQLQALYGYIHNRLLEAHWKKSDVILVEVLDLLTTMTSGWRGAAAQLANVEISASEAQAETSAREEVPAYAGAYSYGAVETASNYSAHSYSF
jgi:flagellar protein FliS